MGIKVRDRIRNFMRLRKQSDSVKIICLFLLVGVVFLVCTGYHVWGIFHYAGAPAEYILSGDGLVSNKRMDELMQSRDVSGASRQMEISISVHYGGAETALDCTILSPEYMERLFGTEIPKGSSRIYMNEAAFAEFQETLSENSKEIGYEERTGSEEGGTELSVRYSMGEDAVAAVGGDSGDGDGAGMSGQSYRSAKLILLKTGGEEAESFIYTAETESRLLREASGIRVRFENHDLDGLHVDHLRKMGYEIENEEMIIEEEYELQTELLHIRYGLVICGISILGAVMLRRDRLL